MRYLVVALLFLVLISACISADEDQKEENTLSDIKTTACNSAHSSGTCDKLIELGIVTVEECCQVLGKCCL